MCHRRLSPLVIYYLTTIITINTTTTTTTKLIQTRGLPATGTGTGGPLGLPSRPGGCTRTPGAGTGIDGYGSGYGKKYPGVTRVNHYTQASMTIIFLKNIDRNHGNTN